MIQRKAIEKLSTGVASPLLKSRAVISNRCPVRITAIWSNTTCSTLMLRWEKATTEGAPAAVVGVARFAEMIDFRRICDVVGSFAVGPSVRYRYSHDGIPHNKQARRRIFSACALETNIARIIDAVTD